MSLSNLEGLGVAEYDVELDALNVATTITALSVGSNAFYASDKGAYSIAYGASISQAITARQGTVTVTGAGALGAAAKFQLELTGAAAVIGGTDQLLIWQGPSGTADAFAQGKAISAVVDIIAVGAAAIQITNHSAGTYTVAGGTDIVLSYMFI